MEVANLPMVQLLVLTTLIGATLGYGEIVRRRAVARHLAEQERLRGTADAEA